MGGVLTNVAALTAYGALSRTGDSVTSSPRPLSSGARITRAADDAAGLTISETLRTQLRGMTQAVRNTQDGISLVRTADAGLGETVAILQRMRDLSVQAAGTGALDATSTAAVGAEVDQLKQELDRITATTSFNGIPLLDGTYDRLFQVGASGGETVRVVIPPDGLGMGTPGLGLSAVSVTGGASVPSTVIPAVSDAEVATATELVFTGETPGTGSTAADAALMTPTYAGQTGAGAAITAIDGALGRVLSLRAYLGAVDNRFSHTIDRLSVSVENTAAAESRIRDTEVAAEMTDLTRSQVLAQAGTAMPAQANQSATLVRTLLNRVPRRRPLSPLRPPGRRPSSATTGRRAVRRRRCRRSRRAA